MYPLKYYLCDWFFVTFSFSLHASIRNDRSTTFTMCLLLPVIVLLSWLFHLWLCPPHAALLQEAPLTFIVRLFLQWWTPLIFPYSGKFFFSSPLTLSEKQVEYSWSLFSPFSTLNASNPSLRACKILGWKISWQPYGRALVHNQLFFSCCFWDSLFWIFDILIMCLAVDLFGFILNPKRIQTGCLYPSPD